MFPSPTALCELFARLARSAKTASTTISVDDDGL
jgi:hypothetical protein